MSSWPLRRLLHWIEAWLWLLTVTVFHFYPPLHEAFVVPLFIVVIPLGCARDPSQPGESRDQAETSIDHR